MKFHQTVQDQQKTNLDGNPSIKDSPSPKPNLILLIRSNQSAFSSVTRMLRVQLPLSQRNHTDELRGLFAGNRESWRLELSRLEMALHQSPKSPLPTPEDIHDLYAVPCKEHFVSYHWNRLKEITDRSQLSKVEECRFQYHVRLLQSAIRWNSDLPLVSIIIPCYNENPEILRRTVQSALNQSHENCEILLIDDGAIVPVADILSDWKDRLRIIHQENQGVPSARNLGMKEARGEFIHFLDADDHLDPNCVEEKLKVFFAVPDTEVCFSLYRCIGDNGVKNAATFKIPQIGDEFCPSRGLLKTALKRFPFQISSMMMPRWFALDVGPFEVDLKQSQDNRQWFKMGLRDAKVSGINRELNTRNFRVGSLTSHQSESIWYSLHSFTRNFSDLCADPKFWSCIPVYVPRLFNQQRIDLLSESHKEKVLEAKTHILESLSHLQQMQDVSYLSLTPLLEGIRAQLSVATHRFDSQSETGFIHELVDLLDQLEFSAIPMSPTDLEYWLDCPVTQTFSKTSYQIYRCLNQALCRGEIEFSSQAHAHWKLRIRNAMLGLTEPESEQEDNSLSTSAPLKQLKAA